MNSPELPLHEQARTDLKEPVSVVISVILATYNGSRFIERALSSVQSQTEKNIEIIVVDDCSTDATADIIESLQKADPRIHLIRNEKNSGPGYSRDMGIKAAQAELIAFIDDDDRWIDPSKLSEQKKHLDSYQHTVIVGSAQNEFASVDDVTLKEVSQPMTDKHIRSQMLLRNPFITSSVLLRKESYLRVGGFSSLYFDEDYDLWMKLGEIGNMANIKNAMIRYTVHPLGTGRTDLHEMNRITLRLINSHRKSYPHYILGVTKAYARIILFYLKHLF